MTTLSEIFPSSSSEESEVPEAVKCSQELPQAKKAKMEKNKLTCEECGKGFSDSYSYLSWSFDHPVCDECKNMERDGPHELITKTDAKKQFLLADSYAEDEESENLLVGLEETGEAENLLRYQNKVMELELEIKKLHSKIEVLKQENRYFKELIWGKIVPGLESMKRIAAS